MLAGIIYWGRRPLRYQIEQDPLFEGITYSRQLIQSPDDALIHTVLIDLGADIEFVTTPVESDNQFRARTVSQFAQELETDVAINANFFFPFESNAPWDYYPLEGEPVTAAGLAISDGQIASPPRGRWGALCIDSEQNVSIVFGGCPSGTLNAVGGQPALIRNGQLMRFRDDDLAPRTAVGLDASGTQLIIMTIDGRQPNYSEGVTLQQLAEQMLAAGAYQAVNLDGGGSTTLVINRRGTQTIYNAPFHTRIVMRERPVANHLGIIVKNGNE